MMIPEHLEAMFHDVLTDVFSGTDMASNEWHRTMYRFWLATRAQSQQWHAIDTAPVNIDVLIMDEYGRMAVAYWDVYGDWHPSNVEASYDMACAYLEMGKPILWMMLPVTPKEAANAVDN